MKTKILSFVSAAAIMLGISACHDPYEFTPTHHDENLLSFTASFFNDTRSENEFPGIIDHAAGTIHVVFPYTYPPKTDSYLTDESLSHVRVQCNVILGSTVTPELVWMDLAKENQFTVTGLDGESKTYTVTSEIRKSNECLITDFTLPDIELSGSIDQANSVITMITPDELGSHKAELILSHGATIDPDPRVVEFNYDQDLEFTVTAQNGVDKKVYKVTKGAPALLPAGANFGSFELIWANKLSDYGFTKTTAVTDADGGIAVIGTRYLVLNKVGNSQAVYVNAKTGAQEGTIDLSAVGNSSAGYLNNYRMTSDNNSNIVISSFSKDNGGTITIWRKKGLDGNIEKYLSYAAGSNVGDQLSVVGSLDGDAIITASINGSGVDFFRWVVTGGALQSETPEKVHITGYEGACWGNADIAYINPSNPAGDYIAGAYAKFADQVTTTRGAAYISGASNTISSEGSRVVSSNWVINAVDVIEFNNTHYAVHNSINTFTWGTDDNIYIYDLSTNDLSASPIDFGSNGLKFIGKYGAAAAGGAGTVGFARNGGDVKFAVSSNGVYLYIFFEFANGYVGCFQTDCMASE